MLDSFDFDKGGYSLIILPEKYGLKDTSNLKFTDDINILNQAKADFIVTKNATVYPFACFDDYRILLCKNGNIVTDYPVSRNCNSIGRYASNLELSLKANFL